MLPLRTFDQNQLSKISLWILTVAVAAGIGVYFRLYPIMVYPEFSARNAAQLMIYSNVRKMIDNDLHAKYPKIAAEALLESKNAAVKQFLTDHKEELDSIIDQTTLKILDKRKTTRTPAYLMEVDPYYYLSLTRRLLDNKAPPRETRGRHYLDDQMLAPDGAWYPMDYHPFVGLAVYRLARLAVPEIPLEEAVALLPIFLSVFCVIAFFAVCFHVFSMNRLSTMTGAVYLALSPIFLRRSLWGWYDTDSYNIFFPLLILFFLFLFLRQTDSSRRKISLLLAASVTVAVYSLFWQGWLLEHAMISAAFFLSILFAGSGLPFKQRLASLKTIFPLFILLPLLLTGLLWGWTGLTGLLNDALDLVKSFYLPSFSLWPDAFLTVGELKSSNGPAFIRSLGGLLIPVIIAAGFLPALGRKSGDGLAEKKCAGFAGILFLLTAILGARIERFALLAVVPAAIGVALGARRMAHWVQGLNRFFSFSLRGIFYSLALAYILWQGHLAARYEHPIYNPVWDRAMTYLREKTPPDSIVTSWWSPGHFIRSMGQRRVTFDGATQNTPQSYWVANLFLEPSEEKSAAILRMLNLSGNRSVDFLTKDKKLKLSDAINLIHLVLPMEKNKAKTLLESTLNPADTAHLLSLTHGVRPGPSSYVLIYNDMIEKVMAMEYTGKWNFKKAELFRDILKKKPSAIPRSYLTRASKEHVRLVWSLAEGPYLQDNETFADKIVGRTVYFSNSLKMDLDTLEASISKGPFGSGRIRNVFYMKNGQLQKKIMTVPDLTISALLIQDESTGPKGEIKISYRAVLADERLIQSLLFRLYYLRGEGVNKFKLVAHEEDAPHHTRLLIYQVSTESR